LPLLFSAFLCSQGLGKTVQAIALCAYFCDDWPILVVCPSSLRFNWSSEFLKWMPLVDESDINVIVSTKGNCDGRINIVSYDLVSKMQQRIEGMRSEHCTFIFYVYSSKSESSELIFSHESAKLCELKYHLSETATMSASVTDSPK
jgi:SNF2 family DNA or RNA helicase